MEVYLVMEYNSLLDKETPILAYTNEIACVNKVQELNQMAQDVFKQRKMCESCPLYDLSLDLKDAIKVASQLCKKFKYDSVNEDCINSVDNYTADCTYRMLNVLLN